MKKEKIYTVILQQTVWEEIEIDASNYDDACEIAVETGKNYMGQGNLHDNTDWEVVDLVDGRI